MTEVATAPPLRILAVLQGPAQSGGGNHQSVNALIDLAGAVGTSAVVSVLDIGGSHRDAIDRACVEGRLPRLQVVHEPSKPKGLRGRLKRSKSPTIRALRRLLAVQDRKTDLADFIDNRPEDLVYFLYPSGLAGRLEHHPFIATVWDLCHRDFPEFPEVGRGSEFEARETLFRSHVARAVAVVADSDQIAARLTQDYGVARDRVVVMPFSPSSAITSSSARSTEEVLSKFGLAPGYLFYPAQFWPHKNHVRILQALAIRREAHADVDDRVVFAGSDKGNSRRVREAAVRLGVDDLVAFLGYVDDLDLRSLYLGSKALVMPTYFGPTNLPPLEAWTMQRPVVYPRHLIGQVGQAALVFDVDDPSSLARCLDELDAEGVAERLCAEGKKAIRAWESSQRAAMSDLRRAIERFAARSENFR